jgi:diguanylate cyclase (GGDEF)-like protein
MTLHDLHGRSRRWHGLCAIAVMALSQHCAVHAVVADREQGLPLISTFLPTTFNTPASPVGPQAFALAALPNGAIVVANNSGLLRLGGTSASAWNPTHGNVLSMASSADGTVYVGGPGEIGYFREFGGKFESLTAWAPRLHVQFGDFWITVAARDGKVYFADTTHVFRWDGNTLALVYTGQPELLVGAAFGNGAAVLDPGAGIVVVEGDGAHVLRGSERLKNVAPCALASAQDGLVAVCSDGSVLHWRGASDVEELPVDADVRTLLKGAGVTAAHMRDDDSLLIGTRRSGVLWLDDHGALSGRLSGADWGDSRVFALLPRRDDGFWVGLDYGVAHVEWPGQLARFDAALGLSRAVLSTLRMDGQLMAATTRGVYRLVPASANQAFAHFEMYAPTQTTLFSVAQAGGSLFVASGEGIYAVRNGASERVDSELAYRVLPFEDGKVLLAGGLKGARLLRKSDDDHRWIAQDLPGIDTEIRYIQADADGAIWLSGNYTGVFRVRLATTADVLPDIEHFDTTDGLPHGRIVPVRLPDNIVFDGADGILRFDSAARRFVADGALRALLPKAQGDVRNSAPLDATHALVVQHDRVRLIEHAGDGAWRELFTPLARLPRGMDFRDVHVDDDGSVWIAGNEALFRHRPGPQSTLPELPRPQIRIEGTQNQTPPPAAATNELGMAPRNVHVHFEEAFFVGVEQLTFRTRLAPLESAWSDWQQSPEREMTHLQGGHYDLAVQVRDIFGRQSETANVAFTLAPPWYSRWWALGLDAVALLALLALMIRRRERRLRRRAEELAGLVRARTQELEQASITDALTGLRNRHYAQLTGTPWRERKSGFWLIALIDIDHFKRINDDRGHAAGDEVLRAVARELAAALPADAVTVRWGGEEFLIIVGIAEAQRAPQLVQRLLHAIGDGRVSLSSPPPITVTCSIGWDLVRAGANASLDVVLGSADRKLYAAKRAGRDRACGPADAVVIQRQTHSTAH